MKKNPPKLVKVGLFSGFEKELSYCVPEHLIGKIEVGSIVKVPLRNTFAKAVVTGIDVENFSANFKIKPLSELVQPEKALTKDLILLAYWMRDYYGCSLQSIFEAMIPAVVRLGKSAQSAKEITILRSPTHEEFLNLKKRSPKQHELLEKLMKINASVLKADVLKKYAASTLEALVEKGLLAESKRTLNRISYEDEFSTAELVSALDHTLNDEQQCALDNISKLLDEKKYATHLLYGVTGSGKTEVYIRAMKKVLKEGGSCIFLVPEISLTPQTVGRLRSKLGVDIEELVVWHSNLSDGQRLDAWRSLATGKAKVVVGARSCVFAPLEDLRLIIVDEEHDGAYKQDNTPRYNARDVAVVRASFAKSVCLLGSATPALETLYNSKNGKYGISKITQRVDNAKLPLIYVVDMKHEKAGANISRLLHSKILERIENKEQCILFLNRRGYAKTFWCPDCGTVEECPHCSVSLTWHKNTDKIKCHICGYEARAPFRCKKCNSESAKWKGMGTQKIEEHISTLFPTAKVARMDADAMRRRDDYRKILADFRMGKIDILIGTQMIAKGLDFPRVTLVGLIDADISLHMPDFRASEHTYQLIVQVAGRAGRGDGSGEVIIQTRNPESAPIQYAKRGDMEAFLEEELSMRSKYNYPPARRIVKQIFKSQSLEKLEFYAEGFAKLADEKLSSLAEIRGPTPSPIEKSEDFYSMEIWYFCKNVRNLISKLSPLRKEFPFDDDVMDILDVDPI